MGDKTAFLTHKYYCSQCGAKMIFENEWKDVLICSECGHETELDFYDDEEGSDILYLDFDPEEEEI